jgi:hypothetical protein
MRATLGVCLVLVLGLAAPAGAQTIGYADAIDILAKSCGADILKYCKGVNLGNNRVAECLAKHAAAVSPKCKSDYVEVVALLDKRAAAQAAVAGICQRDAQQFCKLVKTGKGNILNCLLKAAPSVGAKCNQAIDDAGYR